MKEIWNKLDLNRDGVVKTAEVDVFLKNLNSTLSDEDRKEIIKLIDKYVVFLHQKKIFLTKNY
jgi:hypothetical protein